MKKINNIKELAAEKKRLGQRKAELEKAMHYDWRDFKDSLRPGNIAGQVFSKMFGKTKEQEKAESADPGFVSAFVEKISSMLAGKAEEKLKGWFKS